MSLNHVQMEKPFLKFPQNKPKIFNFKKDKNKIFYAPV